MPRLLLVEDDEAIARPLARALEREGFAVDHVDLGADALTRVAAGDVDLVVLDLTLPDIDGLEVCRQVRAGWPGLPVIMLTARAEEVDVVVGFDAGADDYVTKPFRVAELLARIRARLRTASTEGAVTATADTGAVGSVGSTTPGSGGAGAPAGPAATRLRVDVEAHRVWQDGEEVDLTPKEFDLLALLVAESGKVVPRDRIMREVWDQHWWGSTRTLDMHISALRRKLGDDPVSTSCITTVRGVGFRFDADGG